MNSVFSLLPDGGWQRFLCDALWQSTLIAGLGLLVAQFLVRQSAARAWLLLFTLIACAVVPLASLAARSHGWGLVSRSQSTSAAVAWSPDHPTGSTEVLSSDTQGLPSSERPGAGSRSAAAPPDFAPVEAQAP